MRNKKLNQLYAKKTLKTIEYRPHTPKKRTLKSILLNTITVIICVPIILFSSFLVFNLFSMNTSTSAHSERANDYVSQIIEGKALQRSDIIEFQPTNYTQLSGSYYANSGTRRDYSGSFTYALVNDDKEYYYLALHVIPNFIERDYDIEVLVATNNIDSLRDDIRDDMIENGYVN